MVSGRLFGILLLFLLGCRSWASDQLPILFVHGNGDYAAVWQTDIWRFESNGYDPALLSAITFSHPQARALDHQPEVNRSSTADQLAELSAQVDRVLATSGQDKLILIGSSRGGYAIRNFIRHGGAGKVAIAILCGTPNHGVFALPFKWDSEFNGMGSFLRGLNHPVETDPGVRFVTLRSDHNDKFAQPTGKFLGMPFLPTLVWSDGPALDGATNIVLPGLDHREVAFHRQAFAAMFQAITGSAPQALDPTPEDKPQWSGMISGSENGAPTNLPLPGAVIDIFQVDPVSGERVAGAFWHQATGPDGRWGPFAGKPDATYEFVISADTYPTTHIYRTVLPRSSTHIDFRLEPESGPAGVASLVTLTRPRGYLGKGRDIFTIDGRVPDGVGDGVPAVSQVSLGFPVGLVRAVPVVLNKEHVTVRDFPLAEHQRVVAEMEE
jgi:pimeloyl-ACP methyl ester carboxylesterase